MKKVTFLFIFFLSFSFSLFSQIIDYTGRANPYSKLSQEEKDSKLLNLCDQYIEKDDLDNLKKTTAAIKLLLESGANPNQMLGDLSLLYEAVNLKYFPLVKAFIDSGADINFIYDNDYPILTRMIKEQFSNEEIEYALKKGARANLLQNEKGRAPIFEAIGRKDIQLIKLLDSYGADFNVKDSSGMSVLTKAASSNDFEIVKYIISKGIKPAHDKNQTPEIFFALYNKNLQMAKYLVQNGADINEPFISNYGYYTDNLSYPLHALLEIGILQASEFYDYEPYKPEYFKEILKLGANPLLKDGVGRTSIDLAAFIMKECGYLSLEIKGVYVKIDELSSFIKVAEEFLPSSYNKTAAHAFVTGDIEAFKKYSKTYKSDKRIFVVYELAAYFDFPNSEENLKILMNTGLKPLYYYICYAMRQKKNNIAKILSQNVDLKKGDSNWKSDFVSYCKHEVYDLFDDDLLKSFCEGFLMLGFSPETLISDGKTIKDFIEMNN